MNALTDNQPTPAQLRQAELAELLQHPVSVAGIEATEELSKETIAFLLEAGRRKRRFKEAVLDRFNATVGALASDLLVAALNSEALGFCYRPSDRAAFTRTVAESRHYEALKV